MNKKRISYAFLMEMIWVCGFFMLASCFFVLAFAKADHLSRQAEELNHAVLETQNCLEIVSCSYNETAAGPSGTGITAIFYDKDWKPVEHSPADTFYTITVTCSEQDGLLLLTAETKKTDGELLYNLQSAKNLLSASAASERRLP